MEDNTEIIPKLTLGQRIEIIKERAERVGLWNINRTEMAKELNVIPRTIYNDIQRIFKKGIDKDSVNKAIVNIDNLNKTLLSGLLKDFEKAKTPHERARIAHALLSTQEKITDFLERYGFKEKIADKLEVNEQVVSVVFSDSNDKYPDIEAEARDRKKDIPADK